MQRIRFGKTGLLVSPLGFGAAPAGLLEAGADCFQRIGGALADAGINVIDTAASYLGAEEQLGAALAGQREDWVLISKCGQSFPDLPGKEWSGEVIEATVERSLRRLRTDYLDVMLLHSCDEEVLREGSAWEALLRAQSAGKVRFIGYSGDNEAAAYATTLPGLAVLETSINLCDQANLAAAVPLARDRDIGVIAKRPLANTAWRPLMDLTGFYQCYAEPYHHRFQAMGLEESEVPWPELALRFTLSHPGVHTAVVGTTKPEHLARNADAVKKGPLPETMVMKIRDSFLRGQERDGQAWRGLI